MALFTEESLNRLRSKIDLVEVLSAHISLKRQGATYKALCPFHEEKTPSFHVQAGGSHYHCFGCGAHGDAIAFFMQHLNLSFIDAVEALAERFAIHLDRSKNGGGKKGFDRTRMKEVLEFATRIYHTLLLHTREGHKALHYLYQRDINLDLIRTFRLGYAPGYRMGQRDVLFQIAKGEKFTREILISSGLLTEKGCDFFSERITLPITDSFGQVIGFSARKFKRDTFGGKYINTPETPLFKKSRILFGLSHSRQRIAKERRAVIVEGQIDALRLIHLGLDITVAPQGTAFGQDHVKILTDLGVSRVFLAMDGDGAGRSAAIKVGNFFQKEGVGVKVLSLPEGSDPDIFVRKNGLDSFLKLMEKGEDYLPFLVRIESLGVDLSDPTQKNQLVQKWTSQICGWEEPILVHESLRLLARLASVPESAIGMGGAPDPHFIKRVGLIESYEIDPGQILESDVLRWLILFREERLFEIAKRNISIELFRNPLCRRIYASLLKGPGDLISLGSALKSEEEQHLLSEIVRKKVNPKKAEEGLVLAIQDLLNRKWMEDREAIKVRIQTGGDSDNEVLKLARAFDEIKKTPPIVVLP